MKPYATSALTFTLLSIFLFATGEFYQLSVMRTLAGMIGLLALIFFAIHHTRNTSDDMRVVVPDKKPETQIQFMGRFPKDGGGE